MALTDESNGNMVMPVSPMYGGNGGGFGGFGGDSWGWIVLLLLLGWGNNGWGGNNMNCNGDFPWLMTGQQNINTNTNNGFRDAMINDGITSIRDGISGLSTQMCNGFSNTQMALANGFAGVEQGANARQMADMQQMFGLQSSLQQCCCDNKAGIEGLKYTIATEACATRTNDTQNTQAILNTINGGIQSIKDQLCQDKIDAKNDEISNLRQSLAMKDLAASQTAQNAFISQGFANEVDQLYNRLSSCPVGTVPVAGNVPLFSCNPSFNGNNGGCGCGGNAFYN